MSSRIGKGFVWVGSANVTEGILRILNIAILSRLLMPRDFGIYAAATAITGLVGVFGQIGVGPSLLQIKKLNERHISSSFVLSVGTATVIAVTLYFSATWISKFFSIDELIAVIQVLAFVFPIRAISVIAENLLLRNHEFEKVATSWFLAFLIGTFLTGTVFALLGFGYWSLVASTFGNAIVLSGLLIFFQLYSVKSLKVYIRESRELMVFAGGFTLSRIFNYIALNADNVVVGRILGDNQLGFYNRSYRSMNSVQRVIGKMINTVLFPVFSKMKNENTESKGMFINGLEVICIVFIPISLIAIVLGGNIVTVLLGPKWNQSILPFKFLAAGIFLRIAQKYVSNYLKGLGLVYHNSMVQFVYALAIISGAIYFSTYGIIGVAMSTVLSILLVYIFLSLIVVIRLDVSLWKYILAHARGAVISGILLLLYSQIGFLMQHSALINLVYGIVTVGFVLLILWITSRRIFFSELFIKSVEKGYEKLSKKILK